MTLDRRRVLEAVGVSGLVALGGCLGADTDGQATPGDGDDGGSGSDDEQAGDDDEEEPTEPSPTFTISTVDVPEQVTAGDHIVSTVGIRNEGDGHGTAEVQFRFDEGAFDETTVSIDADGTGTVTFEIGTEGRDPGRYPVSVRVADEEVRESVEVASPDPDLPENGVVAFVYHDGPIHDYTQAFPAHEAYDTPATTCIVTDWIGQHRGVAERLDEDHLAELHDAGWEIGSHTTDHATLGEFELIRDTHPNDTRVYPELHRHGHHDGKEVELTDGETTVIRTVAGFGDDEDGERYVELTEPVGEAFNKGETVIRYPEEEIRSMLRDSKDVLKELGYEAFTLLAPYDIFGSYARPLTETYYGCVANADNERPRINYLEDFDPYDLRHRYFIEFTNPEAVQEDLDEIAETGALGVFGAHAFKDEVTEERIKKTLGWIEERDIEVMTLWDAVELYATHAD